MRASAPFAVTKGTFLLFSSSNTNNNLCAGTEPGSLLWLSCLFTIIMLSSQNDSTVMLKLHVSPLRLLHLFWSKQTIITLRKRLKSMTFFFSLLPRPGWLMTTLIKCPAQGNLDRRKLWSWEHKSFSCLKQILPMDYDQVNFFLICCFRFHSCVTFTIKCFASSHPLYRERRISIVFTPLWSTRTQISSLYLHSTLSVCLSVCLRSGRLHTLRHCQCMLNVFIHM